jgi:hypothetical protein
MPLAGNNASTARRLTTLVIVILLISFWITVTASVYPFGMRTDFVGFYLGFRMAWDGHYRDMYDLGTQARYQSLILPEEKEPPVYPRPPFLAAAFAPLALLPLRTAFVIWVAVGFVLLAGCSAWAWRRFGDDALIWGALSFPAFTGIAFGQDSSLMLAIAVAGYSLAERGRDFAAGAVWGLALIKFNLLLPLPLAMLAARRWRMLGGFSATGGLLASWSVVAVGIDGLRLYARLLENTNLTRLHSGPRYMMNLESIAANFPLRGDWFPILGAAAALAIGLLALRHAPLWRWTSAAWMASLLVAPHVYVYNGAILLLPTWLAIFQSTSRWTRIAAAAFGFPIPYFLRLLNDKWAVVTPVVVLLFLVALAAESFSRVAVWTRGCEAPASG